MPNYCYALNNIKQNIRYHLRTLRIRKAFISGSLFISIELIYYKFSFMNQFCDGQHIFTDQPVVFKFGNL
jgi:hypothetical protein